ncbi:outer membrane protein assembly factor BamD [Wenyingzhuangia sp. 2_MG-2023]|uniref:outer membrane protein assembly factor BamD n=1 Tax=Wenyingzhuangia sp. 2_MG-2023 TaxID=3062639 RepID=UPI0026E1E6CB|nr:outer membrane protein assembly factor BamD [Wenyingzhuangia sp. 2_MG-2023]MDO6736950.1 outer membrane protein assembly factor BamD [Wenyingzhuangia sp. 2_MG-2023]
MIKIFKCSLVFMTLLLLNSCGEYNKVLNKGTNSERYILANKMYKEGSFDKAIRLYELILPSYAAKPQSEAIIFRLAESNYKTKDYLTAVYYYEKFIRSYPKSTEIGTAQFLIAENYYQLSPKFSVDQKDTRKAMAAFQNFIDENPDSERLEEANKRMEDLSFKLEKKSFEIAKQYYKIGNYKSAIVAFDNVILDYLGTSFKEEAMFYKFKSAYLLGVNSVDYKKEERIKEAIRVYNRYKKAFPTSKYLNEADDLFEKLDKFNQAKPELNS